MEMLTALVQYLREKKDDIVRTIRVENTDGEYDQTYGYPVLAEFETTDFDALLEAIDTFTDTFKEPKNPWHPPVTKE